MKSFQILAFQGEHSNRNKIYEYTRSDVFKKPLSLFISSNIIITGFFFPFSLFTHFFLLPPVQFKLLKFPLFFFPDTKYDITFNFALLKLLAKNGVSHNLYFVRDALCSQQITHIPYFANCQDTMVGQQCSIHITTKGNACRQWRD